MSMREDKQESPAWSIGGACSKRQYAARWCTWEVGEAILAELDLLGHDVCARPLLSVLRLT